VIVVQEARAQGVFVKTLIAAVALIDMVAVVAYAFVSSLLETGGEQLDVTTVTEAVLSSATKFGLAVGIGAGCAALALAITRAVVGPASLGPTMVAAILASWGLGQATGTSSILACTLAGVVLSNLRHDTARAADAYLHPFGGVLFAGFYTFAGMRLDFSLVVPLAAMVALFFVSRLMGKSLSAFTAMSLARMTPKVRRYLGIALLPHGGVAVGLILLVQDTPGLASMHDTVAAVGLAALAVNQLIGPSATRFALQRTGEAGLDRPRLLDFLREQHIVVGLSGNAKETVIKQLAERLYATTDVGMPKEDFIAEVMRREEEESTCLGEGFMIPHASLPEGADVQGVLGLSSEGLDLDAPDGRKVHAVVLLATPEADRKRHLEILAAFASAITRDPNLREQLYHARSAAHAHDILHADDALDFNYFLDEQMAPSRAGNV
jgi:mannitol/fructose-specific phosphotransferase system IIA component (Ntr-type)